MSRAAAEVVAWFSLEGSLILGINCAYHESAAALIRDGEVSFAIEEERLTRAKHAKTARVSNPDELPWNAIRACLEAAPGRTLSDLDAIAYSLVPDRRLALIGSDPYEIEDGVGFGSRQGEVEFNRASCGIPHMLARAAGDDSLAGRFHFVPHHCAHAASALSMRRHSGGRRFWWWTGSARPRPRGSGEPLPKVWNRSRKFRTPTRSACSGSGWPSISASPNSTPARSWAWPLTVIQGASVPNLIACSAWLMTTED